MTVYRVKTDDGYIYIDQELGELTQWLAGATEPPERGVWVDEALWLALTTIERLTATFLKDTDNPPELVAALDYMRASPVLTVADDQADAYDEPLIRYEAQQLPHSDPAEFAIWDYTRQRFAFRGIKTREAADDKAGVLNHGKEYRPLPPQQISTPTTRATDRGVR